MNYTENYHLPQWDETDRIMMDDFNQMCANMEAGLEANAQAAAAAANAAAEKPYVMGSYYSDHGEAHEITLGFRPSFLIIYGLQDTTSTGVIGNFSIFGGSIQSAKVTLTDTGFRVEENDYLIRYPVVNTFPNTFQYIAFR